MHIAEELEPVNMLAVPAGQGVHAELPYPTEKVPAGQMRQELPD
jgi:hypothetical protein